MKTSKIIIYIVIVAVVIYLIYKAYTNYQASGSVFKSGADITDLITSHSGSRAAVGYVSARDCVKNHPGWIWLTNGTCVDPATIRGGRGNG